MGYNGKNNLNQPLIYLNSSSLGKFFREPFILIHSSEKGGIRGRSYLFGIDLAFVRSHENGGSYTVYLKRVNDCPDFADMNDNDSGKCSILS